MRLRGELTLLSFEVPGFRIRFTVNSSILFGFRIFGIFSVSELQGWVAWTSENADLSDRLLMHKMPASPKNCRCYGPWKTKEPGHQAFRKSLQSRVAASK